MLHKKYGVSLLFPIFLLCLIYNHQVFSQTEQKKHVLLIESIVIEGNEKTSAEVIDRYITLKIGQVLDSDELIKNNAALVQTEFFKLVDIYTRPGSEKGLVIVVIEITERKWPRYRFEGGHSDLNGWYFSPIGIRFDNFFGKGNYLGYKGTIGSRISGDYIDFKKPFIFNDKVYFETQLFTESLDYVHYIKDKETEENFNNYGLRVKIGLNNGPLKHIFVGYRVTKYNPDLDQTLSEHLGVNSNKTRVGGLSAGIFTDSRDNTSYPLKGLWGAVTGEVAINIFASQTTFPKLVFDFRTFKKFTSHNVYAFHIKGGMTGKDAPYFERFFLGGSYSLRGFPFSRLTPPGWGSKLFLIQNEIRFPLSNANFPFHTHTAVIFYDSGGIWLPSQIPNLFNLYHTIGFGYRIKLPIIDILRFDAAFPLNSIDNDFIMLHLSLGHSF